MDNINFKLPKMYEKFLEEIRGSEGFSVGDTGVMLYEEEDLPERNLTYEVFEYEPDFFHDWTGRRYGLLYKKGLIRYHI